MFRNLLSTTSLCILFIANLPAQEPGQKFCGYTGMSPWLEWYNTHREEFQSRGGDTAWLYAPVTIHIVGTNGGTGYYSQDQSFRIICEMNEEYAPAHIRFYMYPGEAFVYHNNSNWYKHDWDGGSEMINATKLPNRINAYLVSDPAGNCGYSWQDAIVMGKGCSGIGNSTWAHETGHHLSLPHPFYGWEDFSWDYSQPAPPTINGYPVEKTDNSNCYNAGDHFCDTRPDYLNYRWSCDGNHESVTIQKDPSGAIFKSDASLYMGYALDACTSRFTPEQIAAMRANLYTEHSQYLQESEPGPEIPLDASVELISPIDSEHTQYNNATFTWAPVPNATYYVVQVSTSPMFPYFLYNNLVYNTTSVTVTKGIPNNRVLYWRVRAYSEWSVCLSDNTSGTGVFKTKNLTATNELEKVALIALAPNPVAGGLPAHLTINNDEKMDLRIRVLDASGRQFYSNVLRLNTGDYDIEIPTDMLAAGFYHVVLENEKGVLVKRLVVTN